MDVATCCSQERTHTARSDWDSSMCWARHGLCGVFWVTRRAGGGGGGGTPSGWPHTAQSGESIKSINCAGSTGRAAWSIASLSLASKDAASLNACVCQTSQSVVASVIQICRMVPSGSSCSRCHTPHPAHVIACHYVLPPGAVGQPRPA